MQYKDPNRGRIFDDKISFRGRLLLVFGIFPKSHTGRPEDQLNDNINKVFLVLCSWTLFLLGWIWAIFSFILDLTVLNEVNFFQRSGAVLVATSALVEVAQRREFISSPLMYMSWGKLKLAGSGKPDRVCLLITFFERFGWVSIVIGTVIWAYGDLLLKLLQK